MDVVPDVAFLILFIVIGFVLIGWRGQVNERLAAAWPPPGHDRIDGSAFTGEEIGYLGSGERRSVEAAIARLRVAGAVTYDPETGNLVPTGEPVPEPTALSTAILDAAEHEAPEGIPLHAVRNDPRVNEVLVEQRSRLAGSGHVSDVPPRYFLRAGVPVLLLGVVGVGWAVIPPFRWYTDVPLGVVATLVFLAGLSISSSPAGIPTPVQRMLARVEQSNNHLNPRMNPALTTYGPAAAALAVGLFGLGALGSVDPALAALSSLPVGVPATAAETRTESRDSGGGCGGGGCGTVTSDSGSSCGGGCGGCGGCGG